MLYFINDYSEACHKKILDKLVETNDIKQNPYGEDEYSIQASKNIKRACMQKNSKIYFLSGGTQTNMTIINAGLKNYEAIISPITGHILDHEAGAIEKSGHKIIPINAHEGKIDIEELKKYLFNFHRNPNKKHYALPAMLYISQPTEYGTLYSKSELLELKQICKKYDLLFFVDGARLGYALASPKNDVDLPSLADIVDIFYIGGTKCGALFGEAIVIPKPEEIRNRINIDYFATTIKQNGALLAKSRILGIQFLVLFTDDLYMKISKRAVEQALIIKENLIKKGYKIFVDSFTNQQFIIIDDLKLKELEKNIVIGYMERYDDTSSIIRICTSFATKDEDVQALIELL